MKSALTGAAGVSAEEPLVGEASNSHETDKGLFTVEAPKTHSGCVHRARDFAMLSVCTCGESISDEEVAAHQGIIQCKKAGCETKWVSKHLLVVAAH
jgi:hypothetical protein